MLLAASRLEELGYLAAFLARECGGDGKWRALIEGFVELVDGEVLLKYGAPFAPCARAAAAAGGVRRRVSGVRCDYGLFSRWYLSLFSTPLDTPTLPDRPFRRELQLHLHQRLALAWKVHFKHRATLLPRLVVDLLRAKMLLLPRVRLPAHERSTVRNGTPFIRIVLQRLGRNPPDQPTCSFFIEKESSSQRYRSSKRSNVTSTSAPAAISSRTTLAWPFEAANISMYARSAPCAASATGDGPMRRCAHPASRARTASASPCSAAERAIRAAPLVVGARVEQQRSNVVVRPAIRQHEHRLLISEERVVRCDVNVSVGGDQHLDDVGVALRGRVHQRRPANNTSNDGPPPLSRHMTATAEIRSPPMSTISSTVFSSPRCRTGG